MKKLLTKIPKKLKKMLCLGLACVLTTVTLLGGSAGKYYAANYSYATWTTIRINEQTGDSSRVVELYASPREQYEWSVTEIVDPGSNASVRIYGVNISLEFANSGDDILNKVPDYGKTFTINNVRTTEETPYALFDISMTCYAYVTRFSGYVKINE